MELSPDKLTILHLLMHNEQGLYGSDIVVLTNNRIRRWTVYRLLDMLVQDKLVTEVVEEQAVPRTRHLITLQGIKVYRSGSMTQQP